MDQRTVIEIVKKYLLYLKTNNYDISDAYLFGSYAKGNSTENSDIDLALVLNNLSNKFLTQVELMKISRKFDTRIEPHPFEESDFTTNPFAKTILKEGIRLV